MRNLAQLKRLQLNEYETDPYILYNQAINWHDIIPVFLKIYTDLQEIGRICSQNCFLLFLNNFITETITKTILWANAAKFLQIFRKTGTLPCQSSSIELIDQSHGY